MDTNKILNSDYLDILFEGRNKSYGAYELRKNYPKRMMRSMFVILVEDIQVQPDNRPQSGTSGHCGLPGTNGWHEADGINNIYN